MAENDYPAQVMLQWFINEQVEEEKNAMTAIDQLKMAAGNPSAILMLDQLFGARTAEADRRGGMMIRWILIGIGVLALAVAGTCFYGYKKLTGGGDTVVTSPWRGRRSASSPRWPRPTRWRSG